MRAPWRWPWARGTGIARGVRGLLAGMLLTSASGCLLEQDLGRDTPRDFAPSPDFAVPFDATTPRPDASELRDLLPPFDHAMPPDIACPMERTSCDGVCRSLSNDPMHCGACRSACAAIQICAMGHCDGCPKDQSPCENHCTLLGSDANNCGKCGNVCPMGRPCVLGACVL